MTATTSGQRLVMDDASGPIGGSEMVGCSCDVSRDIYWRITRKRLESSHGGVSQVRQDAGCESFRTARSKSSREGDGRKPEELWRDRQ